MAQPTQQDLANPAFLQYARHRAFGGKIKPEKKDFDPAIPRAGHRDRARRYRLARLRRLIRLYHEWKAQHN